tara:strand:- start:8927 stop:9952 length:1026 start_codon:yes stop_codon:yes gene_type:complete
MIKYSFYILFFSNLLLSSFQHNGQLWIDYNSDNEIASYVAGYIPEFNMQNNKFEISYSNKIIIENSDYNNQDYRYWFRYKNNIIDLKIGLQKISFGSAFILRNLNWFDSIDFRNTTNQTIGQKALQLKYFSKMNYNFNFWAIPDNNNDVSYGSRLEFSNKFGNYGLVFYKDNTNYNHSVINMPQIISNQGFLVDFLQLKENERIGIDYRYDGIFGLWLESSYIKSINSFNLLNSMNFATMGIDYTVNIYNGIYVLYELMSYKFEAIDNSVLDGHISSLMIQYPIGILYDLSFIRIFDNQIKDTYSLIRLITTYDYFTVNYSYSFNPSEYGDNFQVKIIYNY